MIGIATQHRGHSTVHWKTGNIAAGLEARLWPYESVCALYSISWMPHLENRGILTSDLRGLERCRRYHPQ